MIPYGRQDITEKDIEAVVGVLRSNFLTQGPVVPEFERKLCDYTGAQHAVAVNSATSALHIACLALGLRRGDILWTSSITFVASANCALFCGASVDFVDVEPETALISIEKLKEKLFQAKKDGVLPKIIIPVHFAGQPCDLEEIYQLSQKYGFKIIEDAAHAIGAKYKNEIIGNCRYSDITIFSFHPVKIITSGEGGVSITNNSSLSEKMKLLRSHGITRDPNKMNVFSEDPWYYEQIDLGFNYRMSDIHAAIGISQLDRLDQYIIQRKEISDLYNKKFMALPIKPLETKLHRQSSCHLYVIKVTAGYRSYIYNELRESGVGVNVHYIPLYRQPYHKRKFDVFTGSEEYFKEAISLPIFPSMHYDEINMVVDNVLSVINNIAIGVNNG